MYRTVTSRLFRQAILEDIRKVENTRLMSISPRRPPTKRPSVLNIFHQVKPRGYFILAFPVATFALGAWQVKRSLWKANIIEELEARLRKSPVPLPHSLEEISKLEYYPVQLKGQFDHSREILLGPRTLLNSKKPASTLLSDGSNAGYFVFTPFKPNDRDYYILVNRGWIPHSDKDPKRRLAGQIEGEIEINGLIRLTEKKPQFVHANDAGSNVWLYRDLEAMSFHAGNDVAPISIDAKEESSVPGGPIGGQTLINTRNTHYNYAITWFSLSLLSGILWWQTYLPHSFRMVR